MICYTNAGGGGASSSAWAYISVSYPSGSTCTATNGTDTLTAADTSGAYVFEIEEPSSTPETWTVSCTNGTSTKSTTVSISTQYQCELITLSYSRLPTGYQEVEYLESSGTQYIDTGIEASYGDYTWNTKYEITFMMLDDLTHTVGGVAFGSTNLLYGFPATLNSTMMYVFANNYISNAPTPTLNTQTSAVINDASHQLIVDDVVIGTFSTSTSLATGYDVYLFGAYNISSGNATQLGSTRIYAYKRTNISTSEVEQNLVPCYRTSDNVAGMIDLVSGTFLTNAGTGTFTVGADV